MTVHSVLRSALRRPAARRWLLSLGVAALMTAASAAPALARSSGSHGGSHGSAHSGGSHGGSHPSGGSHGSGGFHGGGFHGGGFHGGGFHGGGFHGGGFHGGGFHGGGFRSGFFFPAFWGSFYFGFPYPYGYYGPWGYYGDGYYNDGYYRGRDTEQGALDLDLSPADTQVYVNGEYVGKVDDFDGWPTYLWLDPGTYDIVFYREGYKTLARQVTIYRGLVVDWDDKLEQGPSIRPQDLETKTHERRDARVEQDREMRDRAEHGMPQAPPPPPPSGNWRDRVRGERNRHEDGDYRDEARSARLHLAVTPSDASVYLDGRFIGTGEDVARMSSGLMIDAGPHKLSVVRPGRHAEERQFEIKTGEPLDLSIDLKSE
jgi:hypothetical protein